MSDIDSYVESYTDWLHDIHSAPGCIECDTCGRFEDEESPAAIEFGGGFFCCDVCFEQALESNDLLQEEWTQQELTSDDL